MWGRWPMLTGFNYCLTERLCCVGQHDLSSCVDIQLEKIGLGWGRPSQRSGKEFHACWNATSWSGVRKYIVYSITARTNGSCIPWWNAAAVPWTSCYRTRYGKITWCLVKSQTDKILQEVSSLTNIPASPRSSHKHIKLKFLTKTKNEALTRFFFPTMQENCICYILD
jgi:hypothetical protein